MGMPTVKQADPLAENVQLDESVVASEFLYAFGPNNGQLPNPV
jgi:hypothetical protein